MVEISPEEFMRALAFARMVKNARPRENFYNHLISRLGDMIFLHEARRALPKKDIGDLHWIVMPRHVSEVGFDLRIHGWKIDVKTPAAAMTLEWPTSKKADVFPKVVLEKACRDELAARYKNPKRSKPIGLLDDPIIKIRGEVAGWIGIGSAEQLGEDDVLVSRVEDDLAPPESLWALLKSEAGPKLKIADDIWRNARDRTVVAAAKPRRPSPRSSAALMPPRRAARVAAR